MFGYPRTLGLLLWSQDWNVAPDRGFGLMPYLQFWFRDDNRNENVESWVWGIRSEIEF